MLGESCRPHRRLSQARLSRTRLLNLVSGAICHRRPWHCHQCDPRGKAGASCASTLIPGSSNARALPFHYSASAAFQSPHTPHLDDQRTPQIARSNQLFSYPPPRAHSISPSKNFILSAIDKGPPPCMATQEFLIKGRAERSWAPLAGVFHPVRPESGTQIHFKSQKAFEARAYRNRRGGQAIEIGCPLIHRDG